MRNSKNSPFIYKPGMVTFTYDNKSGDFIEHVNWTVEKKPEVEEKPSHWVTWLIGSAIIAVLIPGLLYILAEIKY